MGDVQGDVFLAGIQTQNISDSNTRDSALHGVLYDMHVNGIGHKNEAWKATVSGAKPSRE